MCLSQDPRRPAGASSTPANSYGVSERAFVEAEVGYALQLAGGSWKVSRWPRRFQGGVGRCSSLLDNRKCQSMDKEPRPKAQVIEYAPGSVLPRVSDPPFYHLIPSSSNSNALRPWRTKCAYIPHSKGEAMA